MKKIFFVVLLFLTVSICSGQSLVWANNIGGVGNDRCWELDLNTNSRVLAVGEFSNIVDFDPGINTTNLSSNGNTDAFVSASDTAGNLLWVKSFGGSGIDFARSIISDSNGDIYISGSFSGTVDFDPSSAIMNLSSNGGLDVFTCKLDANGNLIWVKTFGGTGNDYGLTIKINSSGDIFIGGLFNNTVDFDPGLNTAIKTSAGGEDSYLVKLDNSGIFQWVNAFGGNTSHLERTYSIEIDQNDNILFIGAFSGTTDFDPGPGIVNRTSVGNEDSYLCKMSSNGSLIWVKTWGGISEDLPISLKIGKNGDFYIGGTFRGTTDLDPSSNTSSFSSQGSRDIFFSKIDSSGNYVWGKTIGAVSSELCGALDLDKNDNIYATGYYFITTDFDPGPSVYNLAGGGNNNGDTYLLRLDKNGDFVWALPINTPLKDSDGDVKVDNFGNIYNSGLFSSTFDFDPQSGISNLTSNGNYDAYIQKIFDCDESDTNLFKIACLSYTSPSGKYTWTTNGNYRDTIMNLKGCDSIINISLFITNPLISVIQNGFTLSSNAVNSTFQWLDCTNNYIPLSGETNASYTATANGSYAVEITENGCKDTSICYQIFTVGLDDMNPSKNSFSIFPNPSGGLFHLNFNETFSGRIELIDHIGKTTLKKTVLNSNTLTIDANVSSGIYFIRTTDNDGVQSISKVLIK